MIGYQQPLVSVLTPVYNMGQFLGECIESILGQTYQNYEYIIVNNCSTDQSLEIALAYAKKDSRVRVHSNDQFVGVIENHNIAFRLISPNAKYCKVVSADDFIFPECITKMVELMEANPRVGIAGCYQLCGSWVRWQGFEYPKAVISGREICRRIFLEGDRNFGFGAPTSIMYRANLVRRTKAFYPNSSPHADTSACFGNLRDSFYGFVYQVLSYERMHQSTETTESSVLNRYASAYLNDVIQYGPYYLSKQELERVLNTKLTQYHRFLAANYLYGNWDREFWKYHKARLAELGYPLSRSALLKAGVLAVLRESPNPGQAMAKLWSRISSKWARMRSRKQVPRPVG